MSEEADIVANFHHIHKTFVEETGSWYTLKDSYRMYNVLRERFRTFQWLLDQPGVYHDLFDFTVHVPLLVRKLALKHWPLALYVLNVPEPRWDVLKAIFEPMGILQEYPGEENRKTPPNFLKLCELFGEYIAHLQGTLSY
ncbi:sigma-54 dependent response regulator [Striga asiatica]|uniref:Sigma-54 dependent response regulator n=1 Tax=Striga asiatica TaxID=4170 RepID=A0A5A7QA46_STRAF|nr:sigma-54 dependent response regulator [Striga asiatica]